MCVQHAGIGRCVSSLGAQLSPELFHLSGFLGTAERRGGGAAGHWDSRAPSKQHQQDQHALITNSPWRPLLCFTSASGIVQKHFECPKALAFKPGTTKGGWCNAMRSFWLWKSGGLQQKLLQTRQEAETYNLCIITQCGWMDRGW